MASKGKLQQAGSTADLTLEPTQELKADLPGSELYWKALTTGLAPPPATRAPKMARGDSAATSRQSKKAPRFQVDEEQADALVLQAWQRTTAAGEGLERDQTMTIAVMKAFMRRRKPLPNTVTNLRARLAVAVELYLQECGGQVPPRG
ncbi:hypothetical protein CHLRE_15g643354v5 [Chlamydomonas reinhardtii]|uniref:Uncharacterized protein n=1 Tax=Chlamydomonas reinhardtii TaxID=3055 RepID=A0A2K3CWZ3_CHLRE|nr:uncharacterized protein CHLRE_15g643354v5 [Chlamydomonas reinhardtii]PNW72790.1 hypothetical protein CHLRE_15g643354v5 [Chlamydomonas reinhardtii]